MSPTLAASDRTIIPVCEGILIYWPSRYEHTTKNGWRWTHDHDANI